MAEIKYTRVHPQWHDAPATDTPITASALGQIEDGIVAVTEQANAALAAVASDVASIKMAFRGSYVPGSYTPGDVVKVGSSAYVCKTPVTVSSGSITRGGQAKVSWDSGTATIAVDNPQAGLTSGLRILGVYYNNMNTPPPQTGFTLLTSHVAGGNLFAVYTSTDAFANGDTLTLAAAPNGAVATIATYHGAAVDGYVVSTTTSATRPTPADYLHHVIAVGAVTSPLTGGVNYLDGILNTTSGIGMAEGYITGPLTWDYTDETDGTKRANITISLLPVPDLDTAIFERLV